ncbi:hypothetical protein LWI29_009665 [Acer saccharum]|uniref:Uncharacterized protein n=1 Tax=Acer saccharum TaxID=4024 RepID=A0AA39SRM8_ACESA|nr:hypothetical protein LWI29_009665 [Acer saccharum]
MAHPIPIAHPHPMEDPISQEEKAQLRIAMERSLSEMRVGDARSRQWGGPIISEEESQLRIAMERSLKEMRDKEATRSKGKEKLPGKLNTNRKCIWSHYLRRWHDSRVNSEFDTGPPDSCRVTTQAISINTRLFGCMDSGSNV